MISQQQKLHWSQAFGRSTFGLATWTDRFELGDLKGVTAGHWSGMFSGSRRWKHFADGGWDRYDHYTWSDAPLRGARVYGWAALRFLCAINGIDPPSRRLKGEPFVPDTRLLVTAVWRDLRWNETSATSSAHSVTDQGVNARWYSPIRPFDEHSENFWKRLERMHQ